MAYMGLLNRLSDVSGETGEARSAMEGPPAKPPANRVNATEHTGIHEGVARRRWPTAEEMAKRGMRLNQHGVWTTGREFAKVAA
jgi:hypothetical protein